MPTIIPKPKESPLKILEHLHDFYNFLGFAPYPTPYNVVSDNKNYPNNVQLVIGVFS